MKALSILIAAFIAPNAFASARANTSLNNAAISCVTRGVMPFKEHNGGYQFRVDAVVPSYPLIVSAKFWSVEAGLADALLTKNMGSESMQITVVRARDGSCQMRMLQTNDIDGNEMDIRIQANGLVTSSGTLNMKLNGRPIPSNHGQLECNVDPRYFQQVIAPQCQRIGTQTSVSGMRPVQTTQLNFGHSTSNSAESAQ